MGRRDYAEMGVCGKWSAVGNLWIAASYKPSWQLDMGKDRKQPTPNVSGAVESHQFLHFM